MSSSHLNLVKDFFTENYGRAHPSPIQEEDFQVGIQLFTKIAEELSANASRASSRLFKKKVRLENKPINETTAKIQQFLKEHSYRFWSACEAGFPFSKLEPMESEAALKKSLNNYQSIIVNFLKQDDSVWLTEEDLNSKFGKAFYLLNVKEVGAACEGFKLAYLRDKDIKAGYYMLWLIKHASGCDLKIPPKESFQDSTAIEVLSDFISSQDFTVKSPTNYIELLQFRSSRITPPLNVGFLDQKSTKKFLEYAVAQLQSIPMANWPNKARIITDLLETITTDSKKAAATALQSSSDRQTAEVGNHILSALQAATLKEAIPHFYALDELLSNFNYTHAEVIFGRPFPQFRHDKMIFKNDPDFIRRLNFNEMSKVFVFGDLMLGAYNPNTTFGGKGVPPHLLAYNRQTEKMEWGIPLTPEQPEDLSLVTTQVPMTYGLPRMGPAEYHIGQVGESITLQFMGEKRVHCIDSNTGEITDTILLPYENQNDDDRLYLTPDGIGYQMVFLEDDIKLIGGKISDSCLNPDFEVAAPHGFLLPLSTHVGFKDPFEDELIIFNSKGKHVTLDCLSAYAVGTTLYLVEPNPSQENTCKLTVRTMTTDDQVISEVEKSIVLNTKSASIEKICDNGQLILINGYKLPIFVGLENGEIVYSDHKIPSYGAYHVNALSGDIWSWDTVSQKIWKVSSQEKVFMGSLESGRGTSLLHVDQDNHLFFVDIPY
ncbi:MAG: hypothetical protein COT84_01580 [Chlamydiae bacterium CG10_big_fil_rev_8_21_14_0_10_35_9]|nr:MAG: hypothetical protein COT84_01580 [Chlamydiae bacterium CG10_big_fil_rev_8_21_14_0_10_35_9]